MGTTCNKGIPGIKLSGTNGEEKNASDHVSSFGGCDIRRQDCDQKVVESCSKIPNGYSNQGVTIPSSSNNSSSLISDTIPIPVTDKKNLSTTSRNELDPYISQQLRDFYTRNRKAQRRHTSVMELNDQSLGIRETLSSENKKLVDRYDVFSPDMRSTRWQEFMEILQKNKEKYDTKKVQPPLVSGSRKARTIAVVRPNPNGDGLGEID